MNLSFALTILLISALVTELPIAALFGLWRLRQLAAVALINVITNPPLNYLLVLNFNMRFIPHTLMLLLCLEAVVVLVEWRLLVFALRKGPWRMLILSVVMNFCSFIVGAMIANW